jgi:hypothetical protein
VHKVDTLVMHPTQTDSVISMVSTSTDINHLASYLIDPQTGQTRRFDANYAQLPIEDYPF